MSPIAYFPFSLVYSLFCSIAPLLLDRARSHDSVSRSSNKCRCGVVQFGSFQSEYSVRFVSHMHRNFGEIRTCSSGDMRANVETDTRCHHDTPLPNWERAK